MNRSRFLLAAICVCAAPLTLHANSLEADYLKARDGYVARFDPGDKQVDADKTDKFRSRRSPICRRACSRSSASPDQGDDR